jgi:hypothetical protein
MFVIVPSNEPGQNVMNTLLTHLEIADEDGNVAAAGPFLFEQDKLVRRIIDTFEFDEEMEVDALMAAAGHAANITTFEKDGKKLRILIERNYDVARAILANTGSQHMTVYRVFAPYPHGSDQWALVTPGTPHFSLGDHVTTRLIENEVVIPAEAWLFAKGVEEHGQDLWQQDFKFEGERGCSVITRRGHKSILGIVAVARVQHSKASVEDG